MLLYYYFLLFDFGYEYKIGIFNSPFPDYFLQHLYRWVNCSLLKSVCVRAPSLHKPPYLHDYKNTSLTPSSIEGFAHVVLRLINESHIYQHITCLHKYVCVKLILLVARLGLGRVKVSEQMDEQMHSLSWAVNIPVILPPTLHSIPPPTCAILVRLYRED